MIQFRLLQTGHKSAAFNMALDEVLVERISQGLSKPTLRFYGWQPAAVSIGYFQSMEAEVDLDKCKELGVDVVRRQTGGGAVLHDQEVTYSIHIPLELKLVPEKILDSYERICEGIIKGLAPLGLAAQFVPLNDIVVPTKSDPTYQTGMPGDTLPPFQKISGNAQTRKRGILLQHGTILKAVDVDKMFELLKVPDEKMKGKLIENIKQRVTSIDLHTGQIYSWQDIVDTLILGFKQEFSEIEFCEDSLTEAEIAAVEELASTKYATKTWNYQR